jgi:hypothetical protein
MADAVVRNRAAAGLLLVGGPGVGHHRRQQAAEYGPRRAPHPYPRTHNTTRLILVPGHHYDGTAVQRRMHPLLTLKSTNDSGKLQQCLSVYITRS